VNRVQTVLVVGASVLLPVVGVGYVLRSVALADQRIDRVCLKRPYTMEAFANYRHCYYAHGGKGVVRTSVFRVDSTSEMKNALGITVRTRTSISIQMAP
jgi:hypothetical protein